jgi:hypothetical protein
VVSGAAPVFSLPEKKPTKTVAHPPKWEERMVDSIIFMTWRRLAGSAVAHQAKIIIRSIVGILGYNSFYSN